MCNDLLSFSALDVLLTATGDPRELFILLVNTHFKELQLIFSRAVLTALLFKWGKNFG